MLFTSTRVFIPILSCSQGGSDVITKTALKRINWANYKINQTTDKVGVFVSIVSTKIPYKGAGKEYIGQCAPPQLQIALVFSLPECRPLRPFG
jgi:DNA topoisomerase VI subunit B